MLDTGECTNDEEYKVLAFEAKADGDDIYVRLPPPDELDAMIGSSKCTSPLLLALDGLFWY
jgi:nitrite reductase (NAD(P)H)